MNEITMVAAAVLLLLAGAGIGFFLGRKGRSDATSKLEETRAEFDDYRKDVTRHFDQTAQQFQTIGQQYRDLYEHMAKGAESFCIATEPGSALPFSTQTRLPTEVDDGEPVIDDAAELVADEQPRDHVVVEPAVDEPLESDAGADDEAPDRIDAADTAAEADEGETADGVTELEAEAGDETGLEEPASGDEADVEGAPEKKSEESDRIYH